MIYEQMKVMEGSEATLTAYIPSVSKEIDEDAKYDAIVICPGGGYSFCSQREAEPVALALLAETKACFVLNYSVAPVEYPQSLLELSKSVAMIRENSEKWHINPDKIYVMGFSAGGHLAGSLATMWHEDFIVEKLGIEYGANKPNGAILCYPVLTAKEGVAHEGSYKNLLGNQNYDDVREYLSLENRVSDKTPPVFMWHTFEDAGVNVRNSLDFATACKKNEVPCELHVFPFGAHGLSLADSRTSKKANENNTTNEYVSKWFSLCVAWLKLMDS